MFSADFDYFRPASVAEAWNLLKQHPGSKLLAGGHSLIPLLKLRLASPPALIDIGRIVELRGISSTNGIIRIGALTTHAELAESSVLRDQSPALARAAALVGDPAVRNRGTIGGNVSHADPASDLPTVLLALGATFTVTGAGGTTTIPAQSFFQGMMTTALGEHDLLTTIEVPAQQAGQRSAYVKFAHPASRYAVIGAAAVLGVKNGACTSAAVAVGGVTPKPIRLPGVERALIGQSLSPDVLAKAATQVAGDLGDDILGDLYASAEYRKAVTPVWVKRAISGAIEGRADSHH